MVNYSIDIDVRQPVIFILAVTSVFAAIWVEPYIPPGFEAPSAMGLFGILFWVFDKYLWKLSLIRPLLKIPNLNGQWKGTLKRKDHGKEIDEQIEVELFVTQSWTKLSFVLENNNENSVSGRTRSFSRVVGLFVENKNVILIREIFEYEKAQGLCEWRLSQENGKQFLRGDYFSTALRNGYINLELQ